MPDHLAAGLAEYRKEWKQTQKSGASFTLKLGMVLPSGAPAYITRLPWRVALSLSCGT